MLSTWALFDSESTQEVDVPLGMSVTGVVLDVNGHRTTAMRVSASTGTVEYARVVAAMSDPALVESAGYGRVRVHVYPVHRGSPATVILELTATSLVEGTSIARVDRHTALLAMSMAAWADSYMSPHLAIAPPPPTGYF